MNTRKKKNLFQIAATTTGKPLTKKAYNIALSLFVLYGFLVNILEYVFLRDFFLNINPIVFIISYIVLAIAGSIILNVSHSAVGAFVGYNMFVLPIGGLLSCTLSYWLTVNPDIILYAFIGTAIVTSIMFLFSCVNPELFMKLGGLVMIGFIATLISEILLWIIMGSIPQFFSYLIVVIMSFFIAYDFAMANRVPRTMRNAVVFAANLWLDIINIFIHLIDIFGDD